MMLKLRERERKKMSLTRPKLEREWEKEACCGRVGFGRRAALKLLQQQWEIYLFQLGHSGHIQLELKQSLAAEQKRKEFHDTSQLSVHSPKSFPLCPSCVMTAQYSAVLSSELILPITTRSAPGLPPLYTPLVSIGNSR